MLFGPAFRTTGVILLTACAVLVGQFRAADTALPYLDDENEYIIGELANIIKDQNYRMQNDLRDAVEEEYSPPEVPRKQFTADSDKKQPSFTYDLESNLPEINTGDREIPFAVLPNDRRYYQTDFGDNLVVPGQVIPEQVSARRFHKQDRAKNSEVQSNFGYAPDVGFVAQQVTTENSSTSEVSVDFPQASFAHMSFPIYSKFSQDDYYFLAKAAGVGLAILVVLAISTIACYRMQKNNKAAADIEYPAYGITGPNKDLSPTGDRRLAQSAQMYHYQHQKQQIIAMESNNSAKESRGGSVTDPDSDDENEEGDYTVYECPGLAPAGEMEVKNPLFVDDNTPASPHGIISKDNSANNGVIPTASVP